MQKKTKKITKRILKKYKKNNFKNLKLINSFFKINIRDVPRPVCKFWKKTCLQVLEKILMIDMKSRRYEHVSEDRF